MSDCEVFTSKSRTNSKMCTSNTSLNLTFEVKVPFVVLKRECRLGSQTLAWEHL